MNKPPVPDRVLDVLGYYCPIPVIKTAAAMAAMNREEILEVISDDRGVLSDLPDWCQGHGQVYLGHTESGRRYHLFIRKAR
ncbi:MAG: sulfurtransferase TusA family protein [Acidobacteriota bacterium]